MSTLAKLLITILAIIAHTLGYAALQETITGQPFDPRGSTIVATLIPALTAIWTVEVRLKLRILGWTIGVTAAALVLWAFGASALATLVWLNNTFQGSAWFSVIALYSILPPAAAATGGWFLTRKILKCQASGD